MSFRIAPSYASLPRYFVVTGSNGGHSVQNRQVEKIYAHRPLPEIRPTNTQQFSPGGSPPPSAPPLDDEPIPNVVYIDSNGEIECPALTVLDNTSKPLEVVFKGGREGQTCKVMLAALDGLSAIVHTSNGTFTLAYPDVDRHLVFYSDAWHMFGLDPWTYKFYPTRIRQTLDTGSAPALGFGYNVALNGSGQCAVVGNPEHNNGQGGVYVYTRSTTNGCYTFLSKGILCGERYSQRKDEGRVCIFNSIGTVIGFNSRDSKGNSTFLIFEKRNTQSTSTGASEVSDVEWRLSSVIEEECTDACISADGSRIILGSPGALHMYSFAGAKDGQEWVHDCDIDDETDTAFGTRIALSGNGRFVVSVSAKSTAVVYDLKFPTPARHTLSDSHIVRGLSVAVDYSGETVVVGTDDTYGRICVFTARSLADGYVTRPDPTFDKENILSNLHGIGHAIAISSDGNTLMVGAPKYKSGAGALFVFTRTAGEWTLRSKIVGEQGAVLGYAVAISSGGNTGLVSGIGSTGAVWIVE